MEGPAEMVMKAFGYALAAAAGLAAKAYLLPHLFGSGWAVSAKLADRAEHCSWERTFTYFARLDGFGRHYDRAASDLREREHDAAAGLSRYSAPGMRDLWMPRWETGKVAALFAEQAWLAENNPEDHVQPGDIVVDAAAGVGLFVTKALQRGASKVVAIEPDPILVECLRRNFQAEIAFGRVAVAPALASDGEPEPEDARGAPRTTIDQLVTDLKLARIHFVRVEGGTAGTVLDGSRDVLRRDRPRVLLDLSRGSELPAEAPAAEVPLRASHADYRVSCGPCRQGPSGGRLVVPYVVYFR